MVSRPPARSSEPHAGLTPVHLNPVAAAAAPIKPGKTKPRELVIALAYPIGTDMNRIMRLLIDSIRETGCRVVPITLIFSVKNYILGSARSSRLLSELGTYHQERALQELGTLCRKIYGPAALAEVGLIEIDQARAAFSGTGPPQDVVYILQSLKRKEEVELLREQFRGAFFLLSANSSRAIRTQKLAAVIKRRRDFPPHSDPTKLARELIDRDLRESETEGLGQALGQTFHLADYFVDSDDVPGCEVAIRRFVELLFGNPFLTPSRAEFAMYHATAAQLRSADLSRQVGCAIASTDGSIVAVGTNDVPKAGGGLYWEGDVPDGRDFVFYSARARTDRMREILVELVAHALRASKRTGFPGPRAATASANIVVTGMLEDPGFKSLRFNVIDLGRAVHAEMDAITTAARRGVSIVGCDLYTTTFPCHNCAKHIVAAGLKSVRFIEPYPKSIAEDLYPDSITVDPPGGQQDGKIPFSPFVGVAPRRYSDFYKATSRRGVSGEPTKWSLAGSRSRFARPEAAISP